MGILKYILLFVGLIAIVGCQKEEGDPIYVGKWFYLKANPQESVDTCYHGTWIFVEPDNQFTLFNTCLDSLVTGDWYRIPEGFKVVVDGEEIIGFNSKVLHIQKERMIVETDMFGEITQVIFRKKSGEGS